MINEELKAEELKAEEVKENARPTAQVHLTTDEFKKVIRDAVQETISTTFCELIRAVKKTQLPIDPLGTAKGEAKFEMNNGRMKFDMNVNVDAKELLSSLK